jgi:hypothetical protein
VAGRPARRSVDSELESHAIELRKSPCGSLQRSLTEGHAAVALRRAACRFRRSRRSMCRQVMGVSQELGRSCRLHGKERRREWPSGKRNTPGQWPWHRGLRGANNRCDRGTAERRKRSEAGRPTGSLSTLVVPAKQGHCGSTQDPVEGRGVSDDGIVFGNYDGCIEIRTTYQRNRNG